MADAKLRQTAKKIVSKTILAADESTNTIKKRFDTIGVESNPETNRQYRQLLFTTQGIEKYVSGVILFDETVKQSTDDGTSFPDFLLNKNIISGIKVDKGTIKIPENGEDTFTQGIDDLTNRYSEYIDLKCQFAKWRAVFKIDNNHPSSLSIERNASDLALYALLSQESGIVPIVEPEVMMEGKHTIEKDKEITEKVLTVVFEQLTKYGVDMKSMILKPNMITLGKDCDIQASSDEIAQATLEVLEKTVNKDVPGIAFLSGGQTPDLATENLNAINKIKNKNPEKYPWRLTASFGRALQGEALEAWKGKAENKKKAQDVFINRAEKVYKASLGQL